VKHDLESFFWLLVLVHPSHTAHNDPEGCLHAAHSLIMTTKRVAAAMKFRYLLISPLIIDGNEPLTKMLDTLFALFFDNSPHTTQQAPGVTHKSFWM